MQTIVRLAMSGIVLIGLANISPLLIDLRRGTSNAIPSESRDMANLTPQACSAVLLRRNDVRAELQLDDRQRTEIDRRLVDLEKSIAATNGLLNGPEGLNRMHELVRAKRFVTTETFDKRLVELLKSDQLNRLCQLEIQTEGLHSFLRRAVISELKLSKRQRVALAGLPIGAFSRSALAADREQGLDALRNILTFQQLEMWMNFRGADFPFEDGSDDKHVVVPSAQPTASSPDIEYLYGL